MKRFGDFVFISENKKEKTGNTMDKEDRIAKAKEILEKASVKKEKLADPNEFMNDPKNEAAHVKKAGAMHPGHAKPVPAKPGSHLDKPSPKPVKKYDEMVAASTSPGGGGATGKSIDQSAKKMDAEKCGYTMKDDKPHKKDSPEDKAHDIVEEGQKVPDALDEVKGDPKKMFEHLREYRQAEGQGKKDEWTRSPENLRLGKSGVSDPMLMSYNKRKEAEKSKESNSDMAEATTTNIERKAKHLKELMGDASEDSPPWVVGKLSQAKTHVQDVMDYVGTDGVKKAAKPESAPSAKPPKEWWEKKTAEVKAGNPSYSEEQVSATVGKIWSEMGHGQKKARREAEGKTYHMPKSLNEMKKEATKKNDPAVSGTKVESQASGELGNRAKAKDDSVSPLQSEPKQTIAEPIGDKYAKVSMQKSMKQGGGVEWTDADVRLGLAFSSGGRVGATEGPNLGAQPLVKKPKT